MTSHAGLTVRGVPRVLRERIHARARLNRRSVNREVIVALEEQFGCSVADSPAETEPGSPACELSEQVAAWEGLVGSWKSAKPIEEEIHALYAARSKGRDVQL